MGRLFANSVAEFNDRTRRASVVTAKTRKRCPVCRQMVEVGSEAVLTDDRYADDHIGRGSGAMTRVVRGAWHLTHVACAENGGAN